MRKCKSNSNTHVHVSTLILAQNRRTGFHTQLKTALYMLNCLCHVHAQLLVPCKSRLTNHDNNHD
jgi:hypothetical protein